MSSVVVGRRFVLSILAVSLVALGLACSSNGPVETEPAITISISPTSASVVQGQTTEISVTVTGSGGFTGAASIVLQGPPTGVSGTVSGSQSSGGNTTATLTVNVGESVAPGSYTLTVQASGSGVSSVTASFALTVEAAPAYQLSATPAQLMIVQGGEGTSSIAISRTNFAGNVTLSVEGAPAGMASSFDANPVSGNAALLTFTVDAAVDLGTYDLTLRGVATGLLDRELALQVTVTDPEAPDFMLGLAPSSLSIRQGASEDATVSVSRSNFSGAVTLSAEGVPSDVTVSFSENPVTSASSTMTVAVAASATAGSYSITVRGTATGLADRTVTLGLVIEEDSSYGLILSPTTVSIAQSGSGTVDISIARVNFAEAVDLSLEDAPAGVSGTFSVDPVTGNASVLTLDVAASVATGSYTLTVRGMTTSLSDETATLMLDVTAGSGFFLDAITPISIQQGQSGVRTVTISRVGGFSGDVTVTVTDLPAGITASVNPTTTSGGSVDVTVDVSGAVAVGNYAATVRGNATGLPESTQTLDISVLTASGQQVSLDFSACVAEQRPLWLAYQDGSGPWTPVSGTGDTYTFNIASSTAAIAVSIQPSAGDTGVFVLYATQSEIVTGDLSELCDFTTTGKSVSGTVAGLNPLLGEGAAISLGDAVSEVAGNGPFAVVGVADGNTDLVGYKWSTTGATDRMLFMRDMNPADGSNLGTIDFSGGSAFDPAAATITVQGGVGTDGFWEMEYATSPSAGVCQYSSLDSWFYTNNQFTARGAPGAQQQAGDYHVLTLYEGTNYVSESFATLQNRTIAFGAPIPAPAITDISGGGAYRRVRAAVMLPAEYNSLTSLSLIDDPGNRFFTVLATADWLGGLNFTLEVPDLSGLAGWDDAWAPPSTSTTDWIFQGTGWTGTDCVEGAREVGNSIIGSVG